MDLFAHVHVDSYQKQSRINFIHLSMFYVTTVQIKQRNWMQIPFHILALVTFSYRVRGKPCWFSLFFIFSDWSLFAEKLRDTKERMASFNRQMTDLENSRARLEAERDNLDASLKDTEDALHEVEVSSRNSHFLTVTEIYDHLLFVNQSWMLLTLTGCVWQKTRVIPTPCPLT